MYGREEDSEAREPHGTGPRGVYQLSGNAPFQADRSRFSGSRPLTLPILTNESVGETLRKSRGEGVLCLHSFSGDVHEWGISSGEKAEIGSRRCTDT